MEDRSLFDELKKEGFLEITFDFKHPYQKEMAEFQSKLIQKGIKYIHVTLRTHPLAFMFCDPESIRIGFKNPNKTWGKFYYIKSQSLRDNMERQIEYALELYERFKKEKQEVNDWDTPPTTR